MLRWKRKTGRWLPLLLLALTAAGGAASAQTAQEIRIVAVTNSADFQPGLPQKGSLASIFVTGLEGAPGIVTATGNPLTNELAGVSVWINFLPAPILAIAFASDYQQINVQVPWEGQREPLYVEVFQNDIRAHTEETRTDAFNVLFVDADGYGIVRHATDFSLVTPANPAHPGEDLIAYGINLGPVINTPPTGSVSPSDPPAIAVAPAVSGICGQWDQIAIGSVQVRPSFVGLAPGSVGVYQINFRIPEMIGSGDMPLAFVRTLTIAIWGVCFGNGMGSSDVVKTSRTVVLPIR